MLSPHRAALGVALLLAGTLVAAAGDGDGCWATSPTGYGCWGWAYPAWGSYGLESVPFYALHPPVYYSHPVPRPYGYSPFAYPPGTPTPEVVAPQPLTIQNPFVPQPTSQPVKPERTAALPLRIRNPFVAQSDAAPIPADWKASPQVIYPAKLARAF